MMGGSMDGKMNNEMKKEPIERRSVSIYPRQWFLVDTLAKERSMSASAAVRTIVEEWYNLRNPARQDGKNQRLKELVKGYLKRQITAEELAVEMVVLVLAPDRA